MERISEGRGPKHWTSAGRMLACCGLIGAILVVAGPVGGVSANPVTPLVADEASGVIRPIASASPTGEQVISYLRSNEVGLPIPGLVSRTNGGSFSTFEALSAAPALSPPTIGFGSGGTALLAWHTVSGTEQTVRPQGGPAEVADPAGVCSGPVAVAVSNADRTLTACRSGSGTSPAWSGAVGLSQMPSPTSPATTVIPATDDPEVTPFAAWGTDGTGVVAFGYGEAGPPAEERIEARVYGPDSSFTGTGQVGAATDPETLEPTGAAVLSDGTVAITADGDEGGVLFTRPPGSGTSFTRTDLVENTASMPSTDHFNRLHFLTSISTGSEETTWWVRILEPDRSLRQAIPIPTEGDSPSPVEGGLIVYPNGTEAIVMKSSKGFFIAFRKPGAGAFSVPRRLASTTNAEYGAAARTAENDILLAWEREVTPGRRQVMVGGWDGGALPVVRKLTTPKRVRRGARARYTVVATDSMGIARITWRFPGGRQVDGPSVQTRLTRPGMNRVQVAVFDQAGGRSIRIRQVRVVVPRGTRTQGLAGTSGSPRP